MITSLPRFDLSDALATDDPLGLRSLTDGDIYALFQATIAVDTKVAQVRQQLALVGTLWLVLAR